MAGEGHESKKDNDLFYTCSLIDYIARKTKNTRADVVNKLGKQRIDKIYDLADIYHCDNIDRVSEDFIEEAGMQEGNFNNVGDCKYSILSVQRLMTTTAVYITKIRHIYLNRTEKTKCYKQNG